LHEKVHVVRHKAVRKNRELFLTDSAQKLRQDELHDLWLNKQLRAEIRAKREGISVAADVREGLQTVRAFRVHAVATASPVPAARQADLNVSTMYPHG
jgi:hypothetical protein